MNKYERLMMVKAMEDKNFGELMTLFTTLIVRARQSGGLYCDGVNSI